jgi:hypothetical protein
MAKALIVAKMKQVDGRGAPDLAQEISRVHLGSVELPGHYKAFIVAGTGAQLLAIAGYANFLVGQQITKDGEVEQWSDANKAIAPGAAATINTWLTNNGYAALTAQDSILDLLEIFEPGISNQIGVTNVHNGYG